MSFRSTLIPVLLLSLAASLNAQISTATLVGTVKDATGAVVAGAKVDVRNVDTGIVRSTSTDGGGEYALTNLPAARYNLGVSMAGFKTFTATNIELQVAQRLDARRASRSRRGRPGTDGHRRRAAHRHRIVISRAGGRYRSGGTHAFERAEFLAIDATHSGRELYAGRPGHAHRRQVHSLVGGERHDQRHRAHLDRMGVGRRVYLRDANRRYSHPAEHRRDPGVQSGGVEHARRVRAHSDRGQRHHAQRHEPVSRNTVRVSAERQVGRPQFLLHPSAGIEPEQGPSAPQSIRRDVWRSDPQGSHVLLPRHGTYERSRGPGF